MQTTVNRLGSAAAPFRLLDTAGVPHQLEDHGGRWLLLIFHRHLA
jgi:hypothetical protein